MAQPSLEHFVVQRYMHDLQQMNYQPAYRDAEGMLRDALDILAAMNKAGDFMKAKIGGAARPATT